MKKEVKLTIDNVNYEADVEFTSVTFVEGNNVDSPRMTVSSKTIITNIQVFTDEGEGEFREATDQESKLVYYYVRANIDLLD